MLAMLTTVSAGKEVPFIRPKGFDLPLQKLEVNFDTHALFRGEFTVTGTFVAQWIRDTNRAYKKYDHIEYVIELDDYESKPTLPYFDPYLIETVQITNTSKALEMVGGIQSVAQLKGQKIEGFRSRGTFVISRIDVGVRCDSPWATARLVRVLTKQQIAKLERMGPASC